MGKLTFPEKATIALDTNPLIYFFEEISPYVEFMDRLFQDLMTGKVSIICSSITITKIFVKPFQQKQKELQSHREDGIINNNRISIIPLSTSIALDAAKIRGDFNFRTPEAIQLATAQKYADVFLLTIKNQKLIPTQKF